VTVAAPPETTDLTDALHRAGVAVGDIDRVVPMHQRSQCYRVDLSDGASLFVKRARRSATGEWSADVVAEGVRLQQLSTLLPGQDCFPAVLVLDPDQRMLVTAGYPDHTQLDIARDTDDAGPALAYALGIALAALHSASRPDAAIVSGTPIPSADCAESVLTTLLRPTPTVLAAFPGGYTEVLVAIRARGLADPLTDLGAHISARCLIHGDLKSDNILCSKSGAIRIVDWETSGWGDPRWDIGAIIGDRIFGWLSGISFAQPGGLPEWLASARRPFSEVRADLSAFRRGYTGAGGDDLTSDPTDLAVCLGFAAAFLLQRTMASALQAAVLPPLGLAALHLARQLLLRPNEISEALL
jgi:hypothetical protein